MEDKLCPSCEEPVIDKQIPCPLSCMSPKCKAYQIKATVNFKSKPIIWILGGPGCGKGTQCARFREAYGYAHISCGELLRDEVKKNTERSKCLETVMKRGGLVPTDIVLNIIRAAIASVEPTTNGFLLDGYPQDKEQGIVFEKTTAPATAILYFEVSRDTMLDRLHKRALTAPRLDDNEFSMQKRVEVFMENYQNILDHYAEKVYRINGGNDIETVFADAKKVLDPIVSAAKDAKAAVTPPPKAAKVDFKLK